MEDVIVTVEDLAPAGMCPSGAKTWADARGLDFKGFLKNGCPVSFLRALNCPYANRACDQAEARAAARGTK